ncbi:SH3 domain-containing protein [Nocardia sp. XZ_19_385]|uniref:SH3 domain-containing protein n=1 Tax=Nocardia sp. XZ_19_385 TaxID=2769488 RepID=UPI0018903123|nr:hypothetical protein [Nocardia sp. XZ_19_385]
MKVNVLLATAVAVGSTGLSVVLGAPAANAGTACSWNPGNWGFSDSVMDGPYGSYNLYNGNSTSCGKIPGATVVEGAPIRVICHLDNDQGNSWVYLQTSSGNRGWTSRSNVGSWWPSRPKCS